MASIVVPANGNFNVLRVVLGDKSPGSLQWLKEQISITVIVGWRIDGESCEPITFVSLPALAENEIEAISAPNGLVVETKSGARFEGFEIWMRSIGDRWGAHVAAKRQAA